MSNRLLGHTEITGIIRCRSGLRIGGNKELVEIGGLDNPVIKHPITNMPYIPGSSIKGKLRSLLETKYAAFEPDGKPARALQASKQSDVAKVASFFGPHMNTRHELGPTRIICRDAYLTEQDEEKYAQRMLELGSEFLEIKSETAIDRRTNTAMNGSLRTIERVPEGTEFAFSIVLRNYAWGVQADEVKGNLELLFEGMKLLELDYLGGYGSRGSGQIQFINVRVNGELSDQFEVRS